MKSSLLQYWTYDVDFKAQLALFQFLCYFYSIRLYLNGLYIILFCITLAVNAYILAISLIIYVSVYWPSPILCLTLCTLGVPNAKAMAMRIKFIFKKYSCYQINCIADCIIQWINLSACEFKCEADNKCIKQTHVCDGYPNCADGQDEDGCRKHLFLKILYFGYLTQLLSKTIFAMQLC